MSLGLKRGTVKIVDYDPLWPKQFEQEKTALQELLSGQLLQLDHVGSTAVPGLAAKPIIDIRGAVESFDDLDYFIRKLGQLNYEYMPDGVAEDRRFFAKGPRENRTYHLSLVLITDDKQLNDVLLFRDYLRKNTTARNQYADLKRKLAKKHADDRSSYTLAKDDFIAGIIEKAKLSKL